MGECTTFSALILNHLWFDWPANALPARYHPLWWYCSSSDTSTENPQEAEINLLQENLHTLFILYFKRTLDDNEGHGYIAFEKLQTFLVEEHGCKARWADKMLQFPQIFQWQTFHWPTKCEASHGTLQKMELVLLAPESC